MEMNKSPSVCFFAKMPEVVSVRATKWHELRSGEKNQLAGSLFRISFWSFVAQREQKTSGIQGNQKPCISGGFERSG